LQPAQLRDAVLEGVALAGDQIAGQHREIGLHGIGQVDSAPDRRAGHEVADVEVAEVDDAQAFQARG
jgi:hypothetical protein